MSFLPENYTQPESNSGYLKFQKGETRFRFITSPITGWVWFTDSEEGKKIVHRIHQNEKPPIGVSPKHFWSAVVFDYQSDSLKILEITQKTVQSQILGLNANSKWGDPKEYDICVVRTGDGMETEYSVMPEPKTQIDKNLIVKAESIDLNALYSGEDPFINFNQ